jgi:hypothetical protein
MRLQESLLPVTLEATLLLLVSRLLFGTVISSVADRRGKGFLLAVLRLPGNTVHELSHYLGFYLCGYHVEGLTLCIFDPRGRGSCKPGAAWSPVTFPHLAIGLAAVMPLFVGSLVLMGATKWLLVLPALPTPESGHLLPAVWAQALHLLGHLDLHRWQTYVFIYLSLSIGGEVAPSSTDLRYAIPTLLLLAATLWAGLYAFGHAEHLRASHDALVTALNVGLLQLGAVLGPALVICAAAAVIGLLPGLILRSLRTR